MSLDDAEVLILSVDGPQSLKNWIHIRRKRPINQMDIDTQDLRNASYFYWSSYSEVIWEWLKLFSKSAHVCETRRNVGKDPLHHMDLCGN